MMVIFFFSQVGQQASSPSVASSSMYTVYVCGSFTYMSVLSTQLRNSIRDLECLPFTWENRKFQWYRSWQFEISLARLIPYQANSIILAI